MARRTHLALRRCVICGEQTFKSKLVRMVRTPVGTVETDSTGKQAGRGAYLCQRGSCWQQALRRPRRLERALRMDIPAGELKRLSEIIQSCAGE